jgi:outer membrane receptor protein involved in Fe transport
MKITLNAIVAFAILASTLSFAQSGPKIRITGKIIEKSSSLPLEYATVTFFTAGTATAAGGGMTDSKGDYAVDISPGTYDVKFEFISFRPSVLKSKMLSASTDLGTVALDEDITQLNEVVVRAEATTVEIKLDKKVYNVGQDLMVKGGTVSDVLDNIPSVTVDADGTIALRGNDNVRVLIDGRPSNQNISEVLRLLPADAIEKVEVITNPSARYDSEGGGGLLNIILKKGKNQGVNGTIIGTAGNPESYGLSGTINYKTKDFNLFTNAGYNYRTGPGFNNTDSEYLNADGTTRSFLDERRNNERQNEGHNINFGMDYYIDKNTTWSNSLNLRRYNGTNPETVVQDNYDDARNFLFSTRRFNDQRSHDLDYEYDTNFVHNFKKEGHKLSFDGSFSMGRDHDNSEINDGVETTYNNQRQSRSTIKADYVLPLGKDGNSQFEAGYKGDFNQMLTVYEVDSLDTAQNIYVPNLQYTNTLDYHEKINALYTQYGTKLGKFSMLYGLRWEHSDIDIDQKTSNDFTNKKYGNFFPSAFFTYEIDDKSSVSLSYSRRISRPRGRQINPFSNYSSNINIFQGNPDLDPAFTDAFDLGYLKRWKKLTFNTSAYVNKTTNSFQYVRKESGQYVITAVDEPDIIDNGQATQVNGGPDIITPIILTTPINLATEYRFGFEFTLNYTPYKWWKLNSNFNFFQIDTRGDYTYTDFVGTVQKQNFDNDAHSWFTRLSSKVTLPYDIEWQTNLNYNGPQDNAQGRMHGQFRANLALSKDLFKEKATLTLNVQDVFNSGKRIVETNLPTVNSYSEMMWRKRQIMLSFTYRFNKKKEKEKPQRQPQDDNGGDDYPG